MSQTYEVVAEQTSEYRRFNPRGKQWTVRFNSSPPASREDAPQPNPVSHFVADVNEQFEHVVANMGVRT